MIMDIRFCFILLTTLSCLCEGYKILFVSSFPSKSHFILGNGFLKLLTKAGYEVTFITANPEMEVPQSVRVIDVSKIYKTVSDNRLSLQAILDQKVDNKDMSSFFALMVNISSLTIQNHNVQKLLNDPNERYDLIIGEWMYNELYSGLPAIFQCPFIWFSTIEPHWMVLKLIDEIPNPAFVPHSMSNNNAPFTFLQRIEELGALLTGYAYDYFYYSSVENDQYNRLIAPIARKRNNVVPTFDELKYNISLMLGNSHVSMGQPISLPLSYKPIGGYHIDKEVKPLPQDLKTVMDNAKYGVIYFSMGSNLKSKDLPTEMKKNLLRMFGELKQTVLWKFEENLPDRPNNVHILQWAPQQSILSHPNCVLFITHGGLLSTTETIHFGVPIIGIPVFGDQFINVLRAEQKGFAKSVQLTYALADDLKLAIHDILKDPSYSAKVKQLSFIYHHRPTSPGAEMLHWVEHVILTAGAPHLRSPALQVTWYQKLYLDLLAVIVITLTGLYFIVRRLFTLFTCNKRNGKKKKN